MKSITVQQAIEDFKDFYGEGVLDEMDAAERRALPLVLSDIIGGVNCHISCLLPVGQFLDKTKRRWLSEFIIYLQVKHLRTSARDYGVL